MNIREKFGITPGPWKLVDLGETWGGSVCEIKSSDGTIIVDDGSCDGEYARSTPNDENHRLIAAAPEMLKDEIENKKDAHNAMIELEKEKPDLQKVFNLLGNIVSRSANGAEKATAKTWSEIEELSNEL